MSEILFLILVIPIIILLFTPLFKVEFSNLIKSLSFTCHNVFSKNTIFRSFIFALLIFPVEICCTLKRNFLTSSNYVKPIFKGLLTIFLIILSAAAIILGIYKNISSEYTVHPIFALMQIMPIGESLSVRLDFIVYILVFTGLLYAMGFYLYLINHCLKNIFKNMSYGIFVLPLLSIFFVYMFFTPYKTENPLYNNKSTPAIVENIYIENNELIFEIHGYSAENTFFNSHTDNIYDAGSIYTSAYKSSLDFSHTKAIYVSPSVFNQNALLKKLLLQFKKELLFPETLKIKTLTGNSFKYLYSIYLPSQ